MYELFSINASLKLSPAGEGPRRFTMTAYDGGLLRLPNVPVPVVVDLKGMGRADQVKALLFHDPARPVGHMESIQVSDTIVTEGVLSVPENANKIEAAQSNGFEWEASIGAAIEAGQLQAIGRGQSVIVNGRTFQGPIAVARKTTLREVSFVGVGAGENTSGRIVAAATPITQESLIMPDPITPDTSDNSVVDLNKEVSEIRELHASLKSEIDGLKSEREELQKQREEIRKERLVEHVDHIAAKYSFEATEILAELRDKAEAGDINENEIELQVLRAQGQHRAQGLQPLQGKEGAPATPHVIEAALCLTAGWSESELDGLYDEKVINAAIGNDWLGFGLHGLGVEYLRAHGHHVLGGRIQEDDFKAIVNFSEQESIRAAGGFSSVSLPGILSNVAKKMMLRGYDAIPGAVERIAKRANASDYKPFYMYRMSTQGLFEQLGADGELKSMEIKESEYQSRVYPFGKKLCLTHVMMKNDDMNAFQDLPRQFGVMATRTRERQGFKTLLAKESTFWTTGKGTRLADGASSALGLESLKTAFNLFLKFTDSTGEPIGIQPKFLLTATGDHITAQELFKFEKINLAIRDTNAANEIIERPNGNTFRGMFEPLSSPYMNNGVVTNANGTQWILTADPEVASPICVAYLDGRNAPQIKTWESLPGKLGIQWDASFAFGFNEHDDTSSVFSPGQ